MVTTAELQRRGLRYAVVVDGAATPASLQALDRQGLPYLVEVADGATMASRRALEARGLRYLVPVLVDATAASKASLAAQGLRYAVQVDADILPADMLVLQRQGLACYVEVDSSGNSVSAAAVGGGALLEGEANGFATDFTYATDASRVAVKAANVTTNYAVDSFFTQSGTSPKMVYDAAGTLVWSPHNMFIRSEDLTNAAWTRNNVTAPSATRIAEQAITGAHNVTATTPPVSVAGFPYCFWVEATAAECDRIMLYGLSLGGQGLGFDLTNGTTFAVDTIPSAGLLSSGILSLGSGRYRCWISLNASGTSGNPAVYMCSGTAFSYAGSTSRGVTIHRQQLNRGTVPTAYLPTTTAARVGLPLDYDPVTHVAKGLLCEPAATNIIAGSTPPSATSGNWTIRGGLSVTLGQTDPANGTNAALIAGMTGATDCYVIGSSGLTVSANCAASFFMKKVTSTGTLRIDDPVGSNGLWDINLALLGSGWERITRSHSAVTIVEEFNGGTGGNIGLWFKQQAGGPLSFYLWGVTAENGAVASSPIPTTSATVTRAADQVNVTPASINYSATAGSWWVDLQIRDGSSVQGIVGSGAGGTFFLYTQNATQFALYDTTVPSKEFLVGIQGMHKFMSAWKASDRAVTGDGQTPITDTGATAGLLSPATITFGIIPSFNMNGYIRKVRYLPRRPGNAELVTMTT